eukprot:TRINITY_DN7762_c0_g1_i1.p1 TRINITY_DN7762_c0_g1~~TRINITY_DN7762_c0_g1_i1.p1  ORF type:complete len:565 (-),score=120.35 TRINITY_DN7762_c0_g1_i1:34-1728(-)
MTKNYLKPGKGHVFITHGSITTLTCDAIGISAASWLFQGFKEPILKWVRDPAVANEIYTKINRSRYSNIEPSVFLKLGYKNLPPEVPFMWLLNGDTTHSPKSSKEFYAGVVEDYVKKSVKYVRKYPPKNKREKHLICVPVFGIGFVGGSNLSGEITKCVLEILYHYTNTYNIDFALVAREEEVFEAALATRRSMDINLSFPEDDLPRELVQDCEQLIRSAKQGSLVLFFGAGCSLSAGLPSWGALLSKIANKCSMSDEEIEDLKKLNFLDQACVLERRLGGHEELSNVIVEELDVSYHSIIHQLMQALPADHAITTNYDQLYENACAATWNECSVIPYNILPDRRNLLKLHGCITHPEDIVLTRENYQTYADRRQALAGMVESALLTKHMLFLGFSMNDRNFHSIAATVKKVYSSINTGTKTFGTCIQIIKNPLMEEIWDDSVHIVNMKGHIRSPTGSDFASGGRGLEILLDYIVQESRTTTTHLLNPTFFSLLTEDQRCLSLSIKLLMRTLRASNSDQNEAFFKLKKILKEKYGDSFDYYRDNNIPSMSIIKEMLEQECELDE